MESFIIGIAGGTGSGKTTLTKRLKERFGDDVSVISFDNTDICQILSPKLTSLGIDKKVFAVQAFNLMQQAVAKKANGLNYVKLNLSLYERESVRSPEE